MTDGTDRGHCPVFCISAWDSNSCGSDVCASIAKHPVQAVGTLVFQYTGFSLSRFKTEKRHVSQLGTVASDTHTLTFALGSNSFVEAMRMERTKM